jgi:hypothetical protein
LPVPACPGISKIEFQPDHYPKLTDELGLRIFLAAIKLKAGDNRDWDANRAGAERFSPVHCR